MTESSPQNCSTVAVAVNTLLVSLMLRFIAARQCCIKFNAPGPRQKGEREGGGEARGRGYACGTWERGDVLLLLVQSNSKLKRDELSLAETT